MSIMMQTAIDKLLDKLYLRTHACPMWAMHVCHAVTEWHCLGCALPDDALAAYLDSQPPQHGRHLL